MDQLLYRKKDSPILDAFAANRRERWLPLRRRSPTPHRIQIRGFSLLDNPLGTLATLKAIAEAESRRLSILIDFADTLCSDICPYLILGMMRQGMAPVLRGGGISPSVLAMVEAVELSSFLGIDQIDHRSGDTPTFVPFTMRHRRKSGSSTSQNVAFQPSTDEHLIDRLVETINGWLRFFGYALSDDDTAALHTIVSEALNNAQRHSDIEGRDGDWVIAGFLSAGGNFINGQRTSIFYYCSISIISVGATIFESLSACEDAETRHNLDRYVMQHCNDTTRTRESLTTVFALQDRVSRFRQDGEMSAGGVGLMDMIKFAHAISRFSQQSDGAAIAILSGATCIRVNGPLFDQISDDPSEPRNLWFNDKNTIEMPPNHDYVTALPVSFPGTAVAIRFNLRPRALSESQTGEG